MPPASYTFTLPLRFRRERACPFRLSRYLRPADFHIPPHHAMNDTNYHPPKNRPFPVEREWAVFILASYLHSSGHFFWAYLYASSIIF